MRVYFDHDDESGTNYGQWFVDFLHDRAAEDRIRAHAIAATPEEADAILIVSRGDPYYTEARRHSLVNRFREKVFIYDTHNRPISFLPGLFTSMPRSQFDTRQHRTVGYLSPINEQIAVVAAEPKIEPDLLCSFIGAPSAAVRRRLFKNNPFRGRSDAIVVERLGWKLRDGSEAERIAMYREYAVTLARSTFSLCPRGIAAGSYRLFETMELGRVPVVLSDAYVPCVGPKWDSFALFVPESDLAELPAILEKWQPQAAEMGRRARLAWEDWFAPDVQFHRMASWLAELRSNGPSLRPIDRLRWPWLIGSRCTVEFGRKIGRKVRQLAIGSPPLTQ